MIGLIVAAAVMRPAQTLTGRWNYRAFDQSKHLIAEGKLTFEAPEKNNIYWGTKVMRQLAPREKVGPHKTEGSGPDSQKISGQMTGNDVFVDLNAGWKDNNIMLKGTLKGDKISGTWGHATIAGIRERGVFTLIRAK